jgi:hypothetical protein
VNLAYNLELISPEGKVVTTGKLSQASRYMGTSTTAATGGRGLAAGNYHVRIRGQNGDEDSVLLSVSEYDASLENQSLIPEEPMDNLNTEVEGNNENNLKFIKQVILEKKTKLYC